MTSLSKFKLLKMMVDYCDQTKNEEQSIYYLLVCEPTRNISYFFKLEAKEYEIDQIDDSTLVEFIFYGAKTINHINCLYASPIDNPDNSDNTAFMKAIIDTQKKS